MALTRFPGSLDPRRHPYRGFILLASVLVFALYARALSAPFVYDDLDQIANNPNLSQWGQFASRFLLHPVSLTSSLLSNPGSTYRPVFWLTLFVDRSVWGLEPFGYHLTNVLFHLANGLLAYSLLRRLKVHSLEAMAVVAVWLILPINTEVVAWVSGRAYLLCTFFVLSAVLFSMKYVSHGAWPRALCSVLAAGCAVLSHELGVLTLFLVVLANFGSEQGQRKRLVYVVFGIVLILVGAELWRVHLGVKAFAGLAEPASMPLALSKYLLLIVVPLRMSVERSTTLSNEGLSFVPCIALGCFVLLSVYALRARASLPRAIGALVWFLFCIAPFLVLKNYQGLAERFAYLASLGLIAVVGFTCFQPIRPEQRKVMLTIVALWSCWNLFRTSVRIGDWTDPVRLYQASLEATPKSPSLHYNLAFSLRERGDLDQAVTEYQRTLQLAPSFPNGYKSLGDVYLKQDHYAAAQAAYKKALAFQPNDPEALLNMGVAYQSAGDLATAESTFEQVLRADPRSSAAHVNLGVLYADEQRTNDAMHQFAMAIDLRSKDIVPYYNLGIILQQAGRPDLALVLYKKALEIKPDDADTLRAIQLAQATH